MRSFEAWREGKHHKTVGDLKAELTVLPDRIKPIFSTKKAVKSQKERMQRWWQRAEDAQKVAAEEALH